MADAGNADTPIGLRNNMDGIKKFVYAVIEFELNEVIYISAAPLKWIDEENNTCSWPPKKGRERKEIMNNGDPGEDWISLSHIKILGKYATYKESLYYEKKKINSESESSVQEEERNVKQKRKIMKSSKYRDDSISPPPIINEEDELTSDISSSHSDELEVSKRRTEARRVPFNSSQNKLDKNKNYIAGYEKSSKVIHLINPNKAASTLNQPVADDNSSISYKNATITNSILAQDTDTTLEPLEHFETIINNAEVIIENGNYDNTKLDRIINLMIEVKVQQDFISERLGNIETLLEKTKTINSGNRTCYEIENCLIKFPFEDVASIEEFDTKLKENEGLQQSVLNYLQFIGGTTNKLCINRCLEKVFTNFVGQFCCWTGKRGNLKVSDLKIIDVVKQAVRVSYPQMTNDIFERQVMTWFHHSKTRFLRQNSFEKALKKLRKVECSSELGTTEDESVRTRKRPQRFLSSSSSEDDDTYCGHKRPPPLKSNAKSEIADCSEIIRVSSVLNEKENLLENSSDSSHCNDVNINTIKDLSTPVCSQASARCSQDLVQNLTQSPSVDVLENVFEDNVIVNSSLAQASEYFHNNFTHSRDTAKTSSEAIASTEFKVLLKHIVKVEEQNKQIIGLLKSQGQINLYNYNKPVTEELPLKNLEDFHAFEERLGTWNSSDRNSFILYLRSFGGHVLVTKTNNILRHLFTDCLACKFNFYGKGDKLAIKDTKVVDIIVDAVLNQNQTKTEVQNAIKVWLKGAPQRVNNAAKKLQLDK